MNITFLRLQNFKRFTDLTIDLSAEPVAPRLILLIGTNGCGKSSVFDAFHRLGHGPGVDSYYQKDDQAGEDGEGRIHFDLHWVLQGKQMRLTAKSFDEEEMLLESESGEPVEFQELRRHFYGRSAFRQMAEVPSLNRSDLVVGADMDRPDWFIERDERFALDVHHVFEEILAAALEEAFDREDPADTDIRRRFIQPFNDGLTRVFGGDPRTSLRLGTVRMGTNPGSPPQIIFQKGDATIPYRLLSSGEKEVFNILLNFFARRDAFPEAIYYLDELDLHLNTALQESLLREIVEHWLPEGSQLWTASHSLGFIEYAEASDQAVIIDFDALDFDLPQILRPAPAGIEVFEIAVPRSAALKVFPNRQLVYCENTDAQLLNGTQLTKDYLFVPARDKPAVILRARVEPEFLALIDRDFLTKEEIEAAKNTYKNLRILPFYHLESLLYHPDNLDSLNLAGFDKEGYKRALEANRSSNSLRIVARIRESRNNYELLKSRNRKQRGVEGDKIAAAISSDCFDTFYPYLNMRDNRPGEFLSSFNLKREVLAGTDWFARQIAAALSA